MQDFEDYPEREPLSAWVERGLRLREDGRLSEAVACQHRVLARLAGNDGALIELARIAMLRGRLDEARSLLDRALESPSRDLGNRTEIARLQARMGDAQDAERTFREVLAWDPGRFQALEGLVLLLGANTPVRDHQAVHEYLEHGEPTELARARLHFALTAIHDPRGEVDEAIHHALLANAHQENAWHADGNALDVRAYSRHVQNVMDCFDARFFAQRRGWGLTSRRPVFVIGMPRAGATLVEQILASHPQVFGAGALPHIGRGLEALPFDRRAYLNAVQRVEADGIRAFAREYLYRLSEINEEAERVVDRLPLNFLHLGWIATLFPAAAIIHCQRDARDVALSCWLNGLDTLRWSTSLSAITRTYRDYVRLMQHFRRVLPGRVEVVRYEALVGDPEATARAILAHCGLDWDPACLAFAEGPQAVTRTACFGAPQPLHQRRVARWQRYEGVLEPYVAGLMDPYPEAPEDMLPARVVPIHVDVAARDANGAGQPN